MRCRQNLQETRKVKVVRKTEANMGTYDGIPHPYGGENWGVKQMDYQGVGQAPEKQGRKQRTFSCPDDDSWSADLDQECRDL